MIQHTSLEPLPGRPRGLPWLVFTGLLLGAGCSGDADQDADGSDGGPVADAGPLADSWVPGLPAAGGAGDSRLGAKLGATQVRAGRITDKAHLLTGIKVEGRVGDYKLYNGKVAFIIGDARAGSGLGYYGGEVLDAARSAQSGAAGQSLLGETILGAITRGMRPRSVGVVHDGSDGKQALVRVIGELAPVPLLETYIPGTNGDLPLDVVIDYSLAPDAGALQIRLRFFNKRSNKKVPIPMTLLVLTAGDGLSFFTERGGFDQTQVGGKQPYLGMVGRHVSYALAGRGSTAITSVILRNGIWILTLGSVDVPAAGEVDLRLDLVLAGGDPAQLQAALRRTRGLAPPAALSGKVRGKDSAALAGARVHARAISGTFHSMAKTDSTGSYRMELPTGKYLVSAVADGHAPSPEATLSMAKAAVTQDISTAGSATVTFSVADDNGLDLPAKLIFLPKKPMNHPASMGEPVLLGKATRIVYHHGGGERTVSLPPGEYTLTASRGFEYEIDQRTLQLAHGQSTTMALKLTRSVETKGFICGDFHVHAMWSYDASDLYEHKVAAMVAEGLEVPVCSEHDHLGDFNPTIAKMGLQPWIQSIIGDEVTTGKWGHFNAFPVTAAAGKPNSGAVGWYGKAPKKLFAEIRTAWPKSLLQINHPRSDSFGYFSKVGYDSAAGTFQDPSSWSADFDVVEVFNASGWDANEKGSVRDWFSLLDRGLIHTATGNSDSHEVDLHEVGYPRNYVRLSADSPAKLSPSEFTLALKNQQVVVSGGAFISASIDGKGPGETVKASTGKVTLELVVQAPTWVHLDRLRVIAGGKPGGNLLQSFTLDSSTVVPGNPAMRFAGKLQLQLPGKDTWVVVLATGTKKLTPVVQGKQPFGVTNPIFIDVDGNGVYDAPLSL